MQASPTTLTSGQKFGTLTLRKLFPGGIWSCTCQCGQERRVAGQRLESGKVTGCTTCMRKRIFYVGAVLHGWTLLKLLQDSSRADERRWRIQCGCGYLAVRYESYMQRQAKCVGCGVRERRRPIQDVASVRAPPPDLYCGARIGSYTLVSQRPGGYRSVWQCRCDCGAEQRIMAQTFLTNRLRPCPECTARTKSKWVFRPGNPIANTEWVLRGLLSTGDRADERRWLLACPRGHETTRLETSLRNPKIGPCRNCPRPQNFSPVSKLGAGHLCAQPQMA
jgi:hypothetical protein